jgi:hypothetical protein
MLIFSLSLMLKMSMLVLASMNPIYVFNCTINKAQQLDLLTCYASAPW